LAQIKKQGLAISAIDSVFKASVLNKISYALPVYFGYLTEGQKHLLQRVQDRAGRRGFTSCYHNLETLAEEAQYDLFRHSLGEGNCLNHLCNTVKHRSSDVMHIFGLFNTFTLEIFLLTPFPLVYIFHLLLFVYLLSCLYFACFLIVMVCDMSNFLLNEYE